jgi:hypothetical protein
MHTHTEVARDQFEVTDGMVIHTPTGAEFIPHSETEDSLLVWTGEIGRRLSSGEFYQYGEVLAVMKAIWRERAKRMEVSASYS